MNRSQRSSAQCSDYRQKRWHKSIKLANRLDLNYSHHTHKKNNDKYVIACQAFLFMEFSRQKYWSGQPFPSPGDLPGQITHSVVSNSLWPHELQHARPPCSLPTPGLHSNSRPSSQWCHPAISSSVVPFSSCPQSKSTYWIVQGSLLNTLWSFVKRKPKENR